MPFPFSPEAREVLAAERRDEKRLAALRDAPGSSADLALAAALRLAAASGDAEGFAASLERLRGPGARELRAWFAAAKSGNRGFDLAARLRHLAIELDLGGLPRAGLEACDVADALYPGILLVNLTRCTILTAHGELERARSVLASARAQVRGELDDELRQSGDECVHEKEWLLSVLYQPFSFRPAEDPPPAGKRPSTRRTLDEVRALLQVLATRLELRRAALAEGPLPLPDLAKLLPEGPVPLRGPSEQRKAKGTSYVEVVTPRSVYFEWLLDAQGDWAALTYLCWLSGLDVVGLPSKIHPRIRPDDGVEWAEHRLWRSRDQELTGGSDGSSFSWRGMRIGDVPPDAARHIARECAEVQALLAWWADPEVPSPFVDGLRDS